MHWWMFYFIWPHELWADDGGSTTTSCLSRNTHNLETENERVDVTQMIKQWNVTHCVVVRSFWWFGLIDCWCEICRNTPTHSILQVVSQRYNGNIHTKKTLRRDRFWCFSVSNGKHSNWWGNLLRKLILFKLTTKKPLFVPFLTLMIWRYFTLNKKKKLYSLWKQNAPSLCNMSKY